jgi:mRNA-degrading endonuclease RelE of RelBE toxin-antitoxin system
LKVQYRKRFLKDLKALKNQPVYEQILQLAFRDLPNAKSLQDIGNVKPMKGATNRYRIRLGEYRLGIAVVDNNIEVMRLLHRREFYRYFP